MENVQGTFKTQQENKNPHVPSGHKFWTDFTEGRRRMSGTEPTDSLSITGEMPLKTTRDTGSRLLELLKSHNLKTP